MPVEMASKKCVLCGTEYECQSVQRASKFCSQECRNVVHYYKGLGYELDDLERRICPTCGRTFWTYHGSKREYCSHECRIASCNNRKERSCLTCGRRFVPRTRTQRCCCERCRQKRAEALKAAEAAKGNVPTTAPRPEPRGRLRRNQRHCHDCGKPTNDYRCPRCRRKWLKLNGVWGVGEADEGGYRVLCPNKW